MSITKIALRKKGGKLTPYIGTYSQNGRAQMAFKAKYGDRVGACVRSKTKGQKGIDVRKVAKECSGK